MITITIKETLQNKTQELQVLNSEYSCNSCVLFCSVSSIVIVINFVKYDSSLSVDYFLPDRHNLSGDSSSEGGGRAQIITPRFIMRRLDPNVDHPQAELTIYNEYNLDEPVSMHRTLV
jgi:hypothetical protein